MTAPNKPAAPNAGARVAVDNKTASARRRWAGALACIMKLFIRHDGAELGPFSAEEALRLVREGRFLPSDCFRIEGKTRYWMPLDGLPGCPPDLTPSGRRRKLLVLLWVATLVAVVAYFVIT